MPDSGPFNVESLWTTWFLNIQAVQTWTDFYLWERFLNAHPEVKALIELGTGRGGFTQYLLLQCLQRHMRFETFDRIRPEEPPNMVVPNLLRWQDHFHCGDMWGDQRPVIEALIADPANHPLILFCDGGAKDKEYAAFGPQLRAGDFIFVHDWTSEFTAQNLIAGMDSEIMAEEGKALKSMTRWAVKL